MGIEWYWWIVISGVIYLILGWATVFLAALFEPSLIEDEDGEIDNGQILIAILGWGLVCLQVIIYFPIHLAWRLRKYQDGRKR